MIFTEFRFLAFFVLVFAVHWGLRSARGRKFWLLGMSYAFYAAWDWRFLSLIWISTLVDFVAGQRIADADSVRARRNWLRLSLGANLGILGFFKYYHFFLDSTAALLQTFGFDPHLPTLEIILPVGVSFFTFQTMSYSLDIYYRRLQPTRDLLDLSLFVGFFPQLVAGPIVRAADFLPQLDSPRRLASVAFKPALALFLSGFVKKAVISDNLAPMIDAYYADTGIWTAATSWIAVPAYAIQVYCDFSGYSDMAIACAAMLGYRLPLNFDAPFLAADLGRMWRRWHISLSSWLRDYLFIPLGGSRVGRLRTYRNLFLTMLLGGLWHGAGWNFVLWGALHGLGLCVHLAWRGIAPKGLSDASWWRPLAWVLTIWFFIGSLIVFRAPDRESTFTVLKAFLFLDAEGAHNLNPTWFVIFPVLLLLHVAGRRLRHSEVLTKVPVEIFAFGFGALFALAFAFMRVDHPPFIYFQF